MRISILIFVFFISSVNANQHEKCQVADETFIRNTLKLYHSDKYLSLFKLSENVKEICRIENPTMMDGLSYVLFRDTESESFFVRLHNGLDGSFKVYGPFER